MLKQNLVDTEGGGKELSLKLLHKERSFKRLEHISVAGYFNFQFLEGVIISPLSLHPSFVQFES